MGWGLEECSIVCSVTESAMIWLLSRRVFRLRLLSLAMLAHGLGFTFDRPEQVIAHPIPVRTNALAGALAKKVRPFNEAGAGWQEL